MSLIEAAPHETALEAGGHAKGVAVALVRENKDDSGLGRVKVSYPGTASRARATGRASQRRWPAASAARGSCPRIGDEVLVAFERGDLRFPYVVGALWNGKDKPPATNGDGKNDVRMIHSRARATRSRSTTGRKASFRSSSNDGKRRDDRSTTASQLNDEQGQRRDSEQQRRQHHDRGGDQPDAQGAADHDPGDRHARRHGERRR